MCLGALHVIITGLQEFNLQVSGIILIIVSRFLNSDLELYPQSCVPVLAITQFHFSHLHPYLLTVLPHTLPYAVHGTVVTQIYFLTQVSQSVVLSREKSDMRQSEQCSLSLQYIVLSLHLS